MREGGNPEIFGSWQINVKTPWISREHDRANPVRPEVSKGERGCGVFVLRYLSTNSFLW
jgi:hypothetical protein